MINGPLLQKVMDKIDELPANRNAKSGEVWNQNHWLIQFFNGENEECGTAACFAGWTTILNGAQFRGATVILRNADLEEYPELANYTHRWAVDSSIVTHVRDYARVVLGLNKKEANDLFHFENTRRDLRAQVAKLLKKYDNE